MAAKLCLECGGSGKVVIPSFDVLGGTPLAFMCSVVQCEKCKGLGYIPILKGTKK